MFGLVWFAMVQSSTHSTVSITLGGYISHKLQSIVQFNVIQHIKDNAIESNSIGLGTAPGHLS